MSPDYRELLSVFSDAEVRFLVVGAYALGVHGIPRATKDLDLWIEANPKNAAKVVDALRRYGAPLHELDVMDLTLWGVCLQIGRPLHRVDIVTTADGLAFESAWLNRLEIMIEGLRVPTIGREDLIRNKRETGRAQDKVDAERLERLTRST